MGLSIQRHVPWVMACLVIAIGFFTMFHRSALSMGLERQAVIEQADEAANRIQNVDHEQLPCCSSGNTARDAAASNARQPAEIE